MRLSRTFSLVNTTVEALAALVGGQIEGGSGQTPLTGAAAIADATEGHLTFFGNAKYLPALKTCRASAALVPLDFSEDIPPVKIKVANPSLAFSQILEKFAPPPVTYEPGVHRTAVIGEDVALGDNVSIQPYAVVERGARIGSGTVVGAHAFIGQSATLGADCRIFPHVTIREGTIIGTRVIIHSGTVVGSDGFGYEFSEGRHVKIPQIGFVQIDDDVEIGANVTIDRARFDRTWIQEGTKIDNLVQIAHNVTIGKHCILVAGVAIAGSTRLGNYVTLAGQVGVAGHLQIGDAALVGAQSGIGEDLPPKSKWFGSPAVPFGEYGRRAGYVKNLPKLFSRVKKLEQILGEKGISLPPES